MPRLTLLGGAVLEDEGDVITGPASQNHPLALLALLAAAPSRTLGRSRLAGLLWPKAGETTARQRLSTCVHRARSVLGKDGLESAGDDLRLNEAALDCDVWEFEGALERAAYEEAFRRYAGPFLDGFRLEGSSAFEKWMSRQRSRLDREYGRALEALAGVAEEGGEPAAAAAWWRKRANQDPYDSRVVRRLMEALVEAGNRAAALRAARTHDRLVREELGISPDPAVAQLAEELRTQSPAEEPAPPEVVVGEGSIPGEAAAAPVDAAPSGVDGPFREASGRDGTRATTLRVVAALLLVGAVAVGGWLLTGGNGVEEARPAEPSIAVLPFDDVGGGRDSEEIGRAIYHGVLTDLANVSGLRVTSPRSASRYAGTGAAVSEIARELGVRWIVDGRVRQVGDRLRVYARLVDAREDETRLAREYERDLSTESVFAIEGDLARRIAESLRAGLTVGERERIDRRPTADLEAYRLYARGRELPVQRTDSALDRAEALFRRAVERDSAFARAWAGLAKSVVLYPAARGRDPDSVFPPGREAARRALELDPELPEAHMALAIVHFYRMRAPASLRRLDRAIELDSSHAKAYHVLNLVHLVMGRPEEALNYARRAVALSPLSPENEIGLALASVATGDHERAVSVARRVQEIEPDYLSGGSYLEWYALYRMGELTEEDTVDADGGKRQLLALAGAASGDPAPARELLARFQERQDRPTFPVGLLQAALGRRTEALETFEAVFRRQQTSGGGTTIRLRYLYPEVLGPLREEPGWGELMREINVAWGLEPDGSLPGGATRR